MFNINFCDAQCLHKWFYLFDLCCPHMTSSHRFYVHFTSVKHQSCPLWVYTTCLYTTCSYLVWLLSPTQWRRRGRPVGHETPSDKKICRAPVFPLPWDFEHYKLYTNTLFFSDFDTWNQNHFFSQSGGGGLKPYKISLCGSICAHLLLWCMWRTALLGKPSRIIV